MSSAKFSVALIGILEDIGIPEHLRLTNNDYILSDHSEKFIGICNFLLDILQKYVEKSYVELKQISSSQEVYEYLKHIGFSPSFPIDQSNALECRLLHYITTIIQSKRLLLFKQSSNSRKKQAAERGKVIFHIDKILNDLQLSPYHSIQINTATSTITEMSSNITSTSLNTAATAIIRPLSSSSSSSSHNNTTTTTTTSTNTICSHHTQEMMNVHELFESIYTHLMTIQTNYPIIKKQQIQTILSSFHIDKNIYEPLFEPYRQAIYEDFLVRRQLMMKRLDVTLESFLWGGDVIGKESEIVAAIQARRVHIHIQPYPYNLQEVLDVPITLLYELSKRVTQATTTSGSTSLIKNIIIGSVPDRGGRAYEMRPKASDIGYTSKKQYFKKNKNDKKDEKDKQNSKNMSEKEGVDGDGLNTSIDDDNTTTSSNNNNQINSNSTTNTKSNDHENDKKKFKNKHDTKSHKYGHGRTVISSDS